MDVKKHKCIQEFFIRGAIVQKVCQLSTLLFWYWVRDFLLGSNNGFWFSVAHVLWHRMLSRVPTLIQTTAHLRISQLSQRKKQPLTYKTIVILPLPVRRLNVPTKMMSFQTREQTYFSRHPWQKKKKNVLISKQVTFANYSWASRSTWNIPSLGNSRICTLNVSLICSKRV